MSSLHSLSRTLATVGMAAMFASCGGGGGGGGNTSTPGGSSGSTPPGPSGPTFSVSPTTVTFNATSPFTAAPAGATLVGTVSGAATLSGTLYIVITGPIGIPSSPVDSVSNPTISGNSGQVTIVPKSPDMVGAGTTSATLSVHACLNDPTCATGELSGSPQSISVSYTVASAIPPDSVMPHVAVAGATGDVVIRGNHLTGTSDVKFGTVAATKVTVISDTEVHASYPPLPEGSYALSLNSGAIAFTGSIVARSSINYPAETLALPETPALISFLRYDADRRALLVGGLYYKVQTTTVNKLWRYTYTGASSAPAWGTPASTPIDGLADTQLSPDGSALFAIATDGVLELSPDGLTTLRAASSGPSPGDYTHLAIANDSMAILTTRALAPSYYYDTKAGTFLTLTMPFGQITPNEVAGTADGSRLMAPSTGMTPAPLILDYTASTSKRIFTAPSGGIGGIAFSNNANRIVVSDPNNASPAKVYAADYGMTPDGVSHPLGTLPLNATGADLSQSFVTIIVNPQGTRAFVLRQNGTLHSYALDQPTASNGDFPEVGAGISLPIPDTAPYGAEVKTAITPDGNTLFIAGNKGVQVVPALP